MIEMEREIQHEDRYIDQSNEKRQDKNFVVGLSRDLTWVDLHSTLILKFNVWFFNAFRTLLYNLLLFPNNDDDDGWGVAVALVLAFAVPVPLVLLLNEIWILGVLFDDDMIVACLIALDTVYLLSQECSNKN